MQAGTQRKHDLWGEAGPSGNGAAGEVLGTFPALVAVESPGGGRIRDKREPHPQDRVVVQGYQGARPVLHRAAATGLAGLVAEARRSGIAAPLLLPVSGFRSIAEQTRLWKEALEKYGNDPNRARQWVAPPGSSAHHSGRAIDLWLGAPVRRENAERLRQTPVFLWLTAHAERFGFYPYDREPWHWEYNPRGARRSAFTTTTSGTAAPEPASGKNSVSWVQHALNAVVGTNLVVDGVDGPATRAAVRRFQTIQGLTPDGIAGPHTRTALVEAIAARSGRSGDAAYTPSSTRLVFEAAMAAGDAILALRNLNGLNMWELLRVLDAMPAERRRELLLAAGQAGGNVPRLRYAQSVVEYGSLPDVAPGDLAATGQTRVADEFVVETLLRRRALEIAGFEHRHVWKGGSLDESDPRLFGRLQLYWRAVGVNRSLTQLADPAYRNSEASAWSAAFLSWVWHQAGAADRFRYAAAHAVYLLWAKNNRELGRDAFFKAYRADEIRPQLGDMVCKWRKIPVRYDSLRGNEKTHADLVVARHGDRLEVLGGNVSNSVRTSVVPLDANGYLASDRHFAVIRLAAPMR